MPKARTKVVVHRPMLRATTQRVGVRSGKGSTYASVLELGHPYGAPRHLAQEYSEALVGVIHAACRWGAPFCAENYHLELDLEADERHQNALDRSVQNLDRVRAQIAAKVKGVAA